MKMNPKTQVTFSCNLELTEDEARAMDALAGYDIDTFIKVFYEHLGSHYLKPHEAGLRSVLLETRKQIRHQLATIDGVRDLFSKTTKSC